MRMALHMSHLELGQSDFFLHKVLHLNLALTDYSQAAIQREWANMQIISNHEALGPLLDGPRRLWIQLTNLCGLPAILAIGVLRNVTTTS